MTMSDLTQALEEIVRAAGTMAREAFNDPRKPA